MEKQSETLSFTLKSGRPVRIDKYDLDFYNSMTELPTADKIELMKIPDTEIEKYLSSRVKGIKSSVMDYLSVKWKYKETESEANIDDLLEYHEIGMTQAEITKKCLGRAKIDIAKFHSILEIFSSDKCEVYSDQIM